MWQSEARPQKSREDWRVETTCLLCSVLVEVQTLRVSDLTNYLACAALDRPTCLVFDPRSFHRTSGETSQLALSSVLCRHLQVCDGSIWTSLQWLIFTALPLKSTPSVSWKTHTNYRRRNPPIRRWRHVLFDDHSWSPGKNLHQAVSAEKTEIGVRYLGVTRLSL